MRRLAALATAAVLAATATKAIDVGFWNIGDDSLDIFYAEEDNGESFLGRVKPHGGEFFAEGESVGIAYVLRHSSSRELAGRYVLRECTNDPVLVTVRWCPTTCGGRMVSSSDECDGGAAVDWHHVCSPAAAAMLTLDSGGQPGLHLVCRASDRDAQRFAVVPDARAASKAVVVELERNSVTARDVVEAAYAALKLVAHPPHFLRPALFTLRGAAVDPSASLLGGGPDDAWVLAEGGLFQWPARAEGAVVDTGNGVALTVLSTRPKVFRLGRARGDDGDCLLSEAQCADIVAAASALLAPSSLAWQDDDDRTKTEEQRTSSNTFLAWPASAATSALGPRFTALLRLEPRHAEDFQVLRYAPGQRYVSHVDFFRPENYVHQPDFHTRTLKRGATNRFATVFMYLNDARGGETHFARAHHGRALTHEWASCTHSNFSVQPARGKVVLFYDMLAAGAPDHYSLHAGCPAKSTKFAANLWFWNDEAYERPNRQRAPSTWMWGDDDTDAGRDEI